MRKKPVNYLFRRSWVGLKVTFRVSQKSIYPHHNSRPVTTRPSKILNHRTYVECREVSRSGNWFFCQVVFDHYLTEFKLIYNGIWTMYELTLNFTVVILELVINNPPEITFRGTHNTLPILWSGQLTDGTKWVSNCKMIRMQVNCEVIVVGEKCPPNCGWLQFIHLVFL